MLTTFLSLLGLMYLALFLVAFFKVRKGGKKFDFIYHWAFWLGAFVWEDLMVFAALHFLFVIMTFLVHDLRIGLLLIGVFWIVRSTGEMIYFFLQQFFRPHHHPHFLNPHFEQLKKIFGPLSDQKGYVLLQVIHQSVVILAAGGVITLGLNWVNIIRWF